MDSGLLNHGDHHLVQATHILQPDTPALISWSWSLFNLSPQEKILNILNIAFFCHKME